MKSNLVYWAIYLLAGISAAGAIWVAYTMTQHWRW